MKTTGTWKTLTFIGSLIVATLIINGAHDVLNRDTSDRYRQQREQSYVPSSESRVFPNTPPPIDPAEEARRAAKAEAKAHAEFLVRHVNAGIRRPAGSLLVGVLTATQDGKQAGNLSRTLLNRLKTERVMISTDFFMPEAASDEVFPQLFQESTDMTKRLELDSSLDGLILARESVVYSENPSLANVLTATMTVDVMVKATRRGGESRTWSFSASGAGFNQTAAHNLATERIEKQLNADTNMSLAIITIPTRP